MEIKFQTRWIFSSSCQNSLPINILTGIKGRNQPLRCTNQANPCSSVRTHRPNPTGGNCRACYFFLTSLAEAKINDNTTTNPVNSKSGTRGNSGWTTSEGGTSDDADASTSEGVKHRGRKKGISEDVPYNKYKWMRGDNTTHNAIRCSKQQQPCTNHLKGIIWVDHV